MITLKVALGLPTFVVLAASCAVTVAGGGGRGGGGGGSAAAGRIEQSSDDLEQIVAEGEGTPLGDKVEDALPKVAAAQRKLAQSPPDRQGALGELEGAVGDLEAAVKDRLLDPARGRTLMRNLIVAARRVAGEAIAQAEARRGDPTKLAEARQLFRQGDARRDAGRFKDAVASYKDACAKAEGA